MCDQHLFTIRLLSTQGIIPSKFATFMVTPGELGDLREVVITNSMINGNVANGR